MEKRVKKRCPFLEVVEMVYCREAPIKKLIPLQAIREPSPCTASDFSSCPFFKEAMERSYFEKIEGFTFQKSYLYHPSHLWFKREDDSFTVGVDDFAVKLLGHIDAIELPGRNSEVKEGAILFSIHCGRRELKFEAPFSGKVKRVNKKVQECPSLVEKDPYGQGWLLNIQPFEKEVMKKFFCSGKEKWIREDVQIVRSFLEREAGVTVPDGGEIREGILGRLTDEGWRRIADLVFKKERRWMR